MAAIYGAVTQHSRANDLNLRANLRREIQSRLKLYVDNKSIAWFKIICDETNNAPHGAGEPIKADIFIKIAPSPHQHVISLPLAQLKRQSKTTAQSKKAAPKKSSLWSKLFG